MGADVHVGRMNAPLWRELDVNGYVRTGCDEALVLVVGGWIM